MQKSLSRNNQKGFTLIELVVVIVILGILAATALPRFFTAAGSARAASLNGLAGAMNSAIAITHAQYLINPVNPVVMEDGTTVAMWGGYPDNTALGIGKAVNFTAAAYVPTYTASGVSAASTFTVTNATAPATCTFTYTASNAATINAQATAGATVGVINTAGC